jgi:hypothetical protein
MMTTTAAPAATGFNYSCAFTQAPRAPWSNRQPSELYVSGTAPPSRCRSLNGAFWPIVEIKTEIPPSFTPRCSAVALMRAVPAEFFGNKQR